MGCYTYLTEQEKEHLQSVTDKDLNEALQEVRALNDGYYLREREVTQKRGFFSSWFSEPGKYHVYELYHVGGQGGFDAQIINFCQDTKWSLNTMVRKSYMLTYLYGILTGYNIAKLNSQQNVQECDTSKAK